MKTKSRGRTQVLCYGGPLAGARMRLHSAGTLVFKYKGWTGRYVRLNDTTQQWEDHGAR